MSKKCAIVDTKSSHFVRFMQHLCNKLNLFSCFSSSFRCPCNTDGTFSAKIDGKAWNGTSLLFDQKKLLNLIKTLSAFKGSSTLSAVGSIANNYDGMRVGFEMTK